MDKKILDRYNTLEEADRYAGKFKRHWTERINDWRERRLVRALLRKTTNGKPAERALDLPCGCGRLHEIVGEFAESVIESDWSFYMLQFTRERQRDRSPEGIRSAYVRATALCLPFQDQAFDVVLSVRLCHHIREQSERLQYVREIMRVSSQWVVFTYFDQNSIRNRLREFRRRFNNKRSKWTLRSSEIETLAGRNNFEVVLNVPLSRLFSGHHYTVLRRK